MSLITCRKHNEYSIVAVLERNPEAKAIMEEIRAAWERERRKVPYDNRHPSVSAGLDAIEEIERTALQVAADASCTDQDPSQVFINHVKANSGFGQRP